jgi:Arc/MetJ-type ribon-helix-helix transcriptional regulator
MEEEIATGRYRSSDELIGLAVMHFLEDQERGQRRLEALRRIGQAVDEMGLYKGVLVPADE